LTPLNSRLTPLNSVMFAWTASKTAPPTNLWGSFRQNAAPTGFLPSTPACFLSPPLAGPLGYFTMPPCRVVDTRNPPGPLGGPALTEQTTRAFGLGGQCGIPADAKAVSLNVTVADQMGGGNFVLFPGTGPAAGTNSISFPMEKNRANNVVVGLIGGIISVRDNQSSGTVNVILDASDFFR
jgi:hypothetical protein